MSSKICFNTRRFSPSKLLLGLGTRLHHVLAPTHAKRTASKLLLTPQRATRDVAAPAGLVEQAIHTSEGTLMSYRLGQGPVWLLMHGWSGSASQFYPLMSHIAAQGYTALAYDHPAHGRSEGNRVTCPASCALSTRSSSGSAPSRASSPTAWGRRHPQQPSPGNRCAAAAAHLPGARLRAPALRHGGALRLLHPAVRCGGQGDRTRIPAPAQHG